MTLIVLAWLLGAGVVVAGSIGATRRCWVLRSLRQPQTSGRVPLTAECHSSSVRLLQADEVEEATEKALACELEIAKSLQDRINTYRRLLPEARLQVPKAARVVLPAGTRAPALAPPDRASGELLQLAAVRSRSSQAGRGSQPPRRVGSPTATETSNTSSRAKTTVTEIRLSARKSTGQPPQMRN
ncbi:MAG: hypothetical protein ACRD0Z_00575 [Acidimicrobiales bacterium]